MGDDKSMRFNDEKEFRTDKRIEPDGDYLGFKIRMRSYDSDHSAVREIFGGIDYYHLPVAPKVVIDIGAYIGLISLLMARTGAEVYAFEPEISSYEILCHNIEINSYKDKVRCIKEAVGNPRMTTLYVHPRASGATSLYLDHYEGLESDKYQIISSISIHDVFSKYDIKYCDLLKLDCEGAERDIINDFDDELANKIGQISVEIHNKASGQKLIEKLKKWYGAECTYSTTKRENEIWVFKKL